MPIQAAASGDLSNGVVVLFEALADERRIEDSGRADECCRRKPRVPQVLRERRETAVEHRAVRLHAVLHRIEAGKHRRVRRHRRGGMRVRPVEGHAACREFLEERRGRLGVPIQGGVVGAQRIERDEHDVVDLREGWCG
jgi:hypothetical protein